MICKYCGKEALQNEKFCKNCGGELEKVESQPKVEEMNFNNSPIEMKNDNSNNNSTNNPEKKSKGNGLKIASLVLGIISLVFFVFNIFLLPLELTGLILAIVYIAKNKKFCAGLVLNIIAIIISIVVFVGGIAFITKVGEELINEYDDWGVEEFDSQFEKFEESMEELEEELEKFDNKVNVYDEDSDKKYDKGYKYIGSEKYGYMKVPNNWYKFVDLDGNDTIQYSYANVWIATIYSIDMDELTPYKYAQSIFNGVKSEGATNVKLTMEKIADEYNAYKVSCYYADENVYLNCWVFEDDNDVKHYIAIEGPEKENDYYDLVNTFTLKK